MYDSIFYVLVAMLLIGLIANASVRPVAHKWHMNKDQVAKVLADRHESDVPVQGGSFGIGRGGLSGGALLAWLAVGLPLAWGTYETLLKAMKLLQ